MDIDYWLCDDCTMIVVNGDATGMDYYYTPDEAKPRLLDIYAGQAHLGHIAVTDEEEEFTTNECDCCGSTLAGHRTGFVSVPEFEPDEED